MDEPSLIGSAEIAHTNAIEGQNARGCLHVVHRDYETRSQLLLRSVGTHRYAADPSTEVLCCAYAVDHEPVELWVPGDPVPPEFIEAANNPDWVVAAHGDHFEICDRAAHHGAALRHADYSA